MKVAPAEPVQQIPAEGAMRVTGSDASVRWTAISGARSAEPDRNADQVRLPVGLRFPWIVIPSDQAVASLRCKRWQLRHWLYQP
jgi:hypothetical protein